MSTATTQQPAPMSAQAKLVKKLEKENARLKADANSLDVLSGQPIALKNSKLLGDHFVVLYGNGGTESADSLIIHKPIGSVARFQEGTWCCSLSRDIPDFLASKDHPGKAKINSNITEKRNAIAIAANLLTMEGGEITYPSKTVRKEALDDAKWYAKHYAEAKGKNISDVPSSFFFMPADDAEAELKYQTGLYGDAKFETDIKPEYKKLAEYEPTTVSLVKQKEAKYLFGIEKSALKARMYLRTAGLTPENGPTRLNDWTVIGTHVPHEPVYSDPLELGKLLNALDEFGEALKLKNIAGNFKKSVNSKDKEQVKSAKSSFDEAVALLATARSKVIAADINWPLQTFVTKELPYVKKSDLFPPVPGGPPPP